MLPFRITTLLFVLLMMMFTVRLGDLFVEVAIGRRPTLVAQQAFANEEAAAEKKEENKDEKKDEKKEGEAKPEREEIPAKVEKQADVKGLEADPFMQEYSDEEVKVLQSLSKRRETLDQRERDLDQREKLLQAAEKKVDEKVAELGKLRTELDALINKQQDMEAARITQLVKIYEGMKPKQAAEIFNDMDFEVMLPIIEQMSERKVALVMAAMDPERARQISSRLAEQKALPKKAADAAAAQ